ncbi:MAG: amino acid adenylation domain-containing protein, partial [Gammaproteobacteria bacterium]
MSSKRYPATDLQKGLLFESSVSKLKSAYIVQRIFTLHELINENLLLKSWETIINRYEGLRGFFTQDFTEIFIIDHIECPVFKYDFSKDTKKESLAKKVIHQDSQKRFEFTEPPLMRFTLIKVKSNKYYFIWSYHHVLMSGPAALKVIKEAFGVYDSKINHKDFKLEPASSYSEQLSLIKHLEHKNAERYWQALLSGYEGESSFISYKANKKINESLASRQGIVQFYITDALYKKIKRASKVNELSESTFIYAAWAILISCYLGTTDIIFGAVRIFPDIFKSHIGLLMNTLPIRVKMNAECSVIDFLRNIRKQYEAIRDYIVTPLSKLKGSCGIAGDRSVFETVVDFKPVSLNQQLKMLGKQWLNRELNQIIDTNYALLLEVSGEKNRFLVEIMFDYLLFNEEFIKQMGTCFKTILDNICSFPNKKLRDVNILTNVQRKQLLFIWNRTEKITLKDKTACKLFENQVWKTPNKVAVIDEEQKLTYQELNKKANQLAYYIRKRYKLHTGNTLQPNTLIALCLDRSCEMIVAILAILKSGGTYVPIDPHYPEERIRFILKDTNSQILLTQAHLKSRLKLSFYKVEIITLDDKETYQSFEKKSTGNLKSINHSDDLMYVIYTSGTTGKPKGVMIEHRNVVNFIGACSNLFKLKKDVQKNFIQFSTVIFDASVFDIFFSLSYGHKLHIIPEAKRRDREEINNFLIKNNIQVGFFSTALLKATDLNLSGLEVLIIGGDTADESLLNKYYKKNITVFNGYGPTEGTVFTSLNKYTHNGSANIGKALSNVKLYVLDLNHNPVPVGVVGELYIGGAGLARGYLNQPELTKERFIDNPFATEKDKGKGYTRFYKTGDLVCWLPNGDIEYRGRNDLQVKIRGFRVEPGEIESTLSKLAGIKQVVVQVRNRPLESGNERYLVAYYVTEKLIPVAQDEVIAYLSKQLPDYMIPSFFVELDELPLTIGGKLDRNALPPPKIIDGSGYVAPRTDLEWQLCRIWEEVLGVDRVGITDDFFRMGGNSIL